MLPNPAGDSLSSAVALASASQAQRRPSSGGREGREGGRGKPTKLKAEPYPVRAPLPVPALIPRLSGLVTKDTHGLGRGERQGSDNCPLLSLAAPGSSAPLRESRRAQAGSR